MVTLSQSWFSNISCCWRLFSTINQNILPVLHQRYRSATGGGDYPSEKKKKKGKEELIFLFRQQYRLSSTLDISSFVFSISASASLLNPTTGTQLQALSYKLGLGFHIQVQTSLIKLYSSRYSSLDSHQVLAEMQDLNSVIAWNVLISRIARRGEADRARFYFDQMQTKNVISWTCMIDAYIRSKKPKSAISIFVQMIFHGVNPNHVCIITVLHAVSSIGVLHICQSLHGQIEKKSLLQSSNRLLNRLLDSYAKCGCIESASRVFKEERSMERMNLVSWTSIISAYAMHGKGEDALSKFEEMKSAGMHPNRVTFLSILNGCSHGGMVDLGLELARKMVEEWGISPDVKHHGCIVHMLGRSAKVEEAEWLVSQVGGDEGWSEELWRTVLGACAVWGNVEVGERVMKKMVKMGWARAGDYVLMSNIFNGAGMYADADRVRAVIGGDTEMVKVAASSVGG